MARHMALALLIPAVATLLYMLLVIIQPVEWYNPQYAVPLIGMLLGNALNGVTVGVKTFLETVSAERAAIDWALAMGASRFEALRCAFELISRPLELRRSVYRKGCFACCSAAHSME
jgi:ABC-type iron transport system FetAB permease component